MSAGRPPIDAKTLTSAAAREQALDELSRWFVDAVAAAGTNDDEARAAMETAIAAFYDIRESAGQPREEYAGHFFRVDGVGLDATGRQVPWDALRARVGDERAAQLEAVFEEAEPAVG